MKFRATKSRLLSVLLYTEAYVRFPCFHHKSVSRPFRGGGLTEPSRRPYSHSLFSQHACLFLKHPQPALIKTCRKTATEQQRQSSAAGPGGPVKGTRRIGGFFRAVKPTVAGVRVAQGLLGVESEADVAGVGGRRAAARARALVVSAAAARRALGPGRPAGPGAVDCGRKKTPA